MLSSFPKIFTLGDPKISGIFDDPVEVTEKLDGSQFVFGKIDGEVMVRSKGVKIYPETTDKLFAPAVGHIMSMAHMLPEDIAFYSETLHRPKHSTLAYDSVPKNHIAVFGALNSLDGTFIPVDSLRDVCDELDVDMVPVLYKGKVESQEHVHALLETASYLGGQKIEGVVVKNYNKELFLNGKAYAVLSGKYVSEAFKEVHRGSWRKENTGKGAFETLCESYKTPARWHKAVMHLAERGELESSPRDIGKLLKEIKDDITAEEKDNIKEELWNMFSKDVLRESIKGFPEWYKESLLESAFTA